MSALHAGMRLAYGHHRYGHGFRIRRYGNVLQCVPFARENSGIELSGNAGTWWNSAAGVYERGSKPEVGSILNFRATGHMPAGHVAVVTNVLDPRHIEIDHANWSGPGRISRDMDVVDVSPANDWTEVRVARGQDSEEFGGIYPTFGFIYDRPDGGTMVANAGVQEKSAAAVPERTAAGAADTDGPEEVAEAPDDAPVSVGRRARFHRHTVPHHRFGRPSAALQRHGTYRAAAANRHHRA